MSPALSDLPFRKVVQRHLVMAKLDRRPVNEGLRGDCLPTLEAPLAVAADAALVGRRRASGR